MDVRDVCIVVGESEQAMREGLGDGSDYGVNLTYVRQTQPQGLAHAVSFAKEFVAGDDFVLYLGDALYSQGFQAFAERFRNERPANLSMVKPVDDPTRFGVANVEDGRIVKLVEKPKVPESNLAMAGLYFFGPELWSVLPDLQPSARGEYEITDAIQMLIDRGHTVLPGLYDGVWFDTGTLDSFLATTEFLLVGKTDVQGEVAGRIGANVAVGAGAIVECEAIEDSVILPGARVKVAGTIRHAVIGGEVTRSADLIGERVWSDEVLLG